MDVPAIGEPFAVDGTEVCGRNDPEIWFPHKGGNASEAKALCNICPREDDCLAFALDRGEAYGVWGGLTEPERRALQRRVAS